MLKYQLFSIEKQLKLFRFDDSIKSLRNIEILTLENNLLEIFSEKICGRYPIGPKEIVARDRSRGA